MPKVGKKHFSYTEKGIAAAKAEAKKAGKTLKSDSKKSVKILKEDSSKTKKALKKVESKGKKGLKKSGKVMEDSLRSGLKKAFSKGGSVPKGYVVARGSGAARPQYFKVNT